MKDNLEKVTKLYKNKNTKWIHNNKKKICNDDIWNLYYLLLAIEHRDMVLIEYITEETDFFDVFVLDFVDISAISNAHRRSGGYPYDTVYGYLSDVIFPKIIEKHKEL